MKSTPRIVILGAGPCGLGAGWRLKELGVTGFTLYERESYMGGLATSFTDTNGFTWDVGGHVIHSHYGYFDTMFDSVLQKKYLTHQRESWVWLLDRFVPYPFQNNIQRLPEDVRDECLAGLRKIASDPAASPENFAQWILASFGEGISKYFLYPYNYKVWAHPPEMMSYQWIGDRVARVDVKRIEKNILTEHDDVSWGPNAMFQFPESGGTGAIWNEVGNTFKSHIQLNKNAIRIDCTKKIVFFEDGTDASYDVLLSTLPLDVLLRISGMKSVALLHSSVTIVGLGFSGKVPEQLNTKCWMYYPEETAPFFRATVFSNYSPHNAPEGYWSLMTEISSSSFRRAPIEMKESVVAGAKATKLIGQNEEPVDVWSFFREYGYPTPTIGRDEQIHPALNQLEIQSIYSRGRFGAWKYEVSNQDHTFMQGVEWVNHVLDGKKEITVFHPNDVNSR